MDIPPDLLRLRVAFLRADQRCKEITEALPAARDIINGLAEIAEQQASELQAARADRMKLVMAIHRHPWLEELPAGDRTAARKALQDAALGELAVNA